MNLGQSKHNLWLILICLLFLILEISNNLACHGDGGGDNWYCYFPMASSLIDGNPSTTYTSNYGWGRGVIFPLVYAVSWKILHPFQYIRPGNAFNEFSPIMLIQGPFFMILALGILLAGCLKIKNPLVFPLALAFYLSIDPFFEVLNNGFIDAFYFTFVAIGTFFLIQIVDQYKTRYFVLIGVIWFILPMIRANGLFYLPWSGLVFGYIFFRQRQNRTEIRQLGRQILITLASFLLCNLFYEVFIYAVNWQPQSGIMKHFPLFVLNSKSTVNLGELGGYSTLFAGGSFLTGILRTGYGYLLNLYFSLWIFPQVITIYKHCTTAWLHLHYNIWVDIPIITVLLLSNIGILVYYLLRREKLIVVIYLGIIAHIMLQSVVHYEPRYYMFAYFGLSCPFFWLLNQALSGNLFLRKNTPNVQ